MRIRLFHPGPRCAYGEGALGALCSRRDHDRWAQAMPANANERLASPPPPPSSGSMYKSVLVCRLQTRACSRPLTADLACPAVRCSEDGAGWAAMRKRRSTLIWDGHGERPGEATHVGYLGPARQPPNPKIWALAHGGHGGQHSLSPTTQLPCVRRMWRRADWCRVR